MPLLYLLLLQIEAAVNSSKEACIIYGIRCGENDKGKLLDTF